MHRPILFLGTCLCLVTAGVLIAVAGLRLPTAIARPPAAYGEITQGYYDAVNTAIATGNSSLIRAYVDEDLFTGEEVPGVAAGRDGLEATLTDLHVTAPDTRLEVEDIAVSGDRITVELAVQLGQGGTFLGIPLVSQPLPWSTVEVLRIRGGKIVELQGQIDRIGAVGPTISRRLRLTGPVRRVVILERITLPPGQAYPLPAVLNSRALMFESGMIHVELTGSEWRKQGEARSSYPTTTVLELENEELIIASADKQVTVTNRGHTEASLVHVSIQLPVRQTAEPDTSVQTGNVKHQVLAGGIPVSLPAGELSLAAGRVELAPGAELGMGATEGVAWVRLESGEVNVSHQGTVRFRLDNGAILTGVGTERLDTSEGMVIEPGASVTLRNDGGEMVRGLVVTIMGTETP